MEGDQKQLTKAIQAAQMYYYQNLPMKKIAAELDVSHSTISRLLTWAKNQGLVEIRINDPRGRSSPLAELIKKLFKLRAVRIVPVAEVAGEAVWRDRVAREAATYLNKVVSSNIVLGVAWGSTINEVVAKLTPKSLYNSHVVQLNGGENLFGSSINHASEVIMQCASNYEARSHLFPVPAYFDYPETKQALWKESSVQRTIELQNSSDIVLFSIGSFEGAQVSELYQGDFLSDEDLAMMRTYGVVGDIANVMILGDGSYKQVPINGRACGPDLELLRNVDRAICVVSGSNKVRGLKAALNAGYVTDLIVDEPTCCKLMELL